VNLRQPKPVIAEAIRKFRLFKKFGDPKLGKFSGGTLDLGKEAIFHRLV
jgi:hypothetical protein